MATTNTQSGTNIHEIADGIFRINTPVALPGEIGFSFNQYLIVDDEPLLFHAGLRQLFPLVREAVEHPEVGPWLEELLNEEIVPVLEGRVEDPAGFGRTTLDRFRNPFLEHKLSAIALNHEAKMKVRLLPTYEEYRTKFGREPKLLSALI